MISLIKSLNSASHLGAGFVVFLAIVATAIGLGPNAMAETAGERLVSTDAKSPADAYNGIVRVYVVEPTSRWTDAFLNPYSFGFLDFALQSPLEIGDGQTWTAETVWNGQLAGFGDIQANNIAVMVAVFNDEAHVTDALPPFGFWFNAYHVDAAVKAEPGEVVTDQATLPYTHTVFIEEGTETT